MTEKELEEIYQEHLEESLIFGLSKRLDIPAEDAMKLYYSSVLAKHIHDGRYGIQYLDLENLTDILEAEILRRPR